MYHTTTLGFFHPWEDEIPTVSGLGRLARINGSTLSSNILVSNSTSCSLALTL